jgi:hypothetical protein
MDLITILKELIDKLLFVGFFMAVLVIIRNAFLFGRHLTNPEPQRYTISSKSLLYLGISVALVLSTLFKGIGL